MRYVIFVFVADMPTAFVCGRSAPIFFAVKAHSSLHVAKRFRLHDTRKSRCDRAPEIHLP